MIRALSGACILEIAALAALGVTVNNAAPAYGDEYRRLSGAEIKLPARRFTDEVHYISGPAAYTRASS